jgi:hypothetical protein
MIFLLLQPNTLKDLDLNIPSFTLHDKHPANSKTPCKFQNPYESSRTVVLHIVDTKKGACVF